MKRICLIGNSHLACIKLGWAKLETLHPEFKLSFFGAPGSRLQDLALECGQIVPTSKFVRDAFEFTSKGQTSIDPSRYDGFILVGLRLNVHAAVTLLKMHTPHTFKGMTGDHLISEELLKCALAETYNNSLALKIARMLRQISPAPIILFPVPMPSERIADKREVWARVSAPEAGERLAMIVRQTAAATANEIADLVWQPEITIVNGIFTRHEFSQNSPGLLKDSARSENDYIHMNEKFGAVALEHVLDFFKSTNVPAHQPLSRTRA